MKHEITEDTLCDLIDPAVDCYGAYSTKTMLDNLEKGGYVIIKKPPVEVFRNKSLIGVNPYAEDLTDMQKLQIIEECKVNPWYFYLVLGKNGALEIGS